jgi:hypothetical protein
MSQPTYYQVTQEQVGKGDLQDFLRKAIQKQFENKEYFVSKEEIVERITPYSKTPRKLRGFLINEGNSIGHAIYFDVTDIKTVEWVA